ncbi:MAG: serine/threonine-protein kinase [Verrucomicrobiota bacterium]
MSNRYEIREQIGKGGLGAVYKAFDTQLQREVAIKRVLSPDQASDEEVQEAASKLIAEAQTLSSLNHPNIITVFDVGQDEQGGFVVMELLKGETLDDTIERGVLTQEDFTEVVYQTQEALIAAQAIDVIHRDIKPTNIMVIWQASGKFQIKILDFGLAKFSRSPSVQTMDQEDSVLGSIFFMAPEQFERGELDARTDLYQMGCVYYNALTGQYPFNGDTAPQVMNAHLQHKVVPLEQIRPDLAPSICQWVMWLINRDIDHRPKDARDALKRWPKNPEPTGEVVLQALPVEDTPEVTTGDIKIVTAEASAHAPPSLIVGASASTPSGAIRRGKPIVSRTKKRGIDPKTKLIIGAVIGVILALIIGISVAGNISRKNQEKRIVELATSEGASGTVADVDTAVAILGSSKSSNSLRSSAMKALTLLTGSGIDEGILTSLKTAESSSQSIPLSRVLGERGYSAAVPAITDKLNNSSSKEDKLQYITAIGKLADAKDLPGVLSVLEGEDNLEVRRHIEDTALEVLYRSDNPGPVIDEMLNRVSSASGNERKSLFHILGALGTDKVKTRLSSIYNKKNNLDYQRDAMIGYLFWKDRSVIPDVEKVINSTNDTGLQNAGEKALARLVTLPGPVSMEQRAEAWERAVSTISDPNDIRRIIGSMIEYPHSKTIGLLRQWNKDNKLKPLMRGSIDSMEKLIAGVKTIQPGDELLGNQARVNGDKRASFNSSLNSITNWTSRDTWFSWAFKLSEEGNYGIEVDQASLNAEPSEFVIYLHTGTFSGESKQTKSLTDFATVPTKGTVNLKNKINYTLVLKAGSQVQQQIMDIRAVRLVKKN